MRFILGQGDSSWLEQPGAWGGCVKAWEVAFHAQTGGLKHLLFSKLGVIAPSTSKAWGLAPTLSPCLLSSSFLTSLCTFQLSVSPSKPCSLLHHFPLSFSLSPPSSPDMLGLLSCTALTSSAHAALSGAPAVGAERAGDTWGRRQGELTCPCRSVFSNIRAQVRVWAPSAAQAQGRN